MLSRHVEVTVKGEVDHAIDRYFYINLHRDVFDSAKDIFTPVNIAIADRTRRVTLRAIGNLIRNRLEEYEFRRRD